MTTSTAERGTARPGGRLARPARAVGPALSLAVWAGAAALPSAAQPVPATNDVAACTLLADPTAQRSCIESARQKRAATSFDPSATRFRSRSRLPDGDVTGLRGSFDAAARRKRNARGRGVDAPAPDQPAQIP